MAAEIPKEVEVVVNEFTYEYTETIRKVCAVLEPLQPPENYCLYRNGVYLTPQMQKMRVFDILRGEAPVSRLLLID